MRGRVLRSVFRGRPHSESRSEGRLPGESLQTELTRLCEQKRRAEEPDNFDTERWRHTEQEHAEIERRLASESRQLLAQHSATFESAYRLLEDRESRELFKALLAFRLLGHRHVRLPANDAGHWKRREESAQYALGPSPFSGVFGPLQRFALEFEGERIELDCWAANVAWTYLIGQYYFRRGELDVAPRRGDVIIDAGACFADTALAFAASAGPGGRVLAFEIDPGNLEVARHNLRRNDRISSRIELVAQGLGRTAGTLYMHGSGPGARLSNEPDGLQVPVTTIDEFVARHVLPRVDFIKMDIEGSESDALKGGRETLTKCRPRLAISVYHHAADIARIPVWLNGLGLGYRFFLDHYTIHHEETVLYATTEK